MKMTYTIEHARKLLAVVDAGLVRGMGAPVPGSMCVEAAVCYALGEPHGDAPSCVHPAVRAFKIRLNDSHWSSDEARAKGMRAIAVAQLGSTDIDGMLFAKRIAELTIREIVPAALRAVGLEDAAKKCEIEGSAESARGAQCYAAAAATTAYATTAAYAAGAADAAHAALAADGADDVAAAYAAATAAACAAATAATDDTVRDQVLTASADIALRVLRECSAPGVALWDAVRAEA